MATFPKVVGLLSCGLLLCLGLLGRAASAADEMKAGQSTERIGGQSGLEDKLEKRKVGAGESAKRIGGQSGLEDDRADRAKR
jgi:hypothetical protein